ncbi:MAG: hypothetical protein HY332_10315 [Chloroflexi bacterium]|nr:hypothetical protein [Chloroflexota bacterium]
MPTTFPFVEIRGGPRERGRQHGEACRHQVQHYAETLLRVLSGEAALRSLETADAGASGRPRLTREDLYARALTFLPFFEMFAPHLVEEIRGIAEGADVPFAAALLVNVRAEVAGVMRVQAPASADGCAAGTAGAAETAGAAGRAKAMEGCTSFGIGREATLRGDVLLGQNQDQAPEMEALGIVLQVRPDDGPPMVMATFGGLVGYPGLNGAGVAFFQNALSNGVWRHALPHYPLKRVLLEQDDVDGCLRTVDRARLASCGNMVIGDRHGRIVDVEATPDGYAIVELEDGVVVHTNHFLSDRFRPEERLLGSLPDSAARLARMSALVDEARGQITLETMQRFLRDHDLGPAGICRHEPERPMKTIASIIAEPDRGLLHVARGNPCENAYVAYSVE